MARPARIWAAIDASYFDDARVIEAGPAWQLHFAAVLACKRLLVDGRLTKRQLHRFAPESVGDVEEAICVLVEVGLFIDKGGDVFSIRSWEKWNDPSADVERASQVGRFGNHKRHHVNRGIVKDDCPYCVPIRGDVAPDSGGDSGGDSVPSVGSVAIRHRTDKDLDADTLSRAVAKVCRLQWSELTTSARARVDEVARELAAKGATPGEVRRRARQITAGWRDGKLTPRSLLEHWAGASGRGGTSSQGGSPRVEPTDPTSADVLGDRQAEWASNHPGEPVPLRSTFRTGANYGPKQLRPPG